MHVTYVILLRKWFGCGLYTNSVALTFYLMVVFDQMKKWEEIK